MSSNVSLQVSAQQAKKNREGIKEMWKSIPAKWVYLDHFIGTHHRKEDGEEYTRNELLKVCDGNGGPHNPCGAVGCFAGWNWMYHPYQAWCKRNKIIAASTNNLSIYLGLEAGEHSLFAGRQLKGHGVSEKKEVSQRIKTLMSMDFFTEVQEAWSNNKGPNG